MNTTPLWEEAARRVADGSVWLVGSRDIAKLVGVGDIDLDDLRSGYDPDLWGTKFHFTQSIGVGFDAFFLLFTPHR